MSIIYSALDGAERQIARQKPLVRLLVKVRNHLNRIIGYHLCEGIDHRLNGEEQILKLIAPHCQSFVDIGANVGSWSSLFLSYAPKTCQGLLFEPGNSAFQKLRDRFTPSAQIKLVQAAIGNETGYIDFFEEPNAGETSSLSQDFVSASAQLVKARITTLDAELPEHNWNGVDYLKIDAEGFDCHVLLGARQLLSNHQIGFIQFEYNSPWAEANTTLAGALKLLKQYGYSCYVIHSDGIYDFNYALYKEFFFYSNFLAVSPKHQHLVQNWCRGEL